MILAFSRAALERTAAPAAVVRDAHGWATVGLVSVNPEAGVRFATEHDLELAFAPEVWGKRENLEIVRERTDDERYVFVGVKPIDEEHATAAGWEYLSLREAAVKAGWTVHHEEEESLSDRVRSWVRSLRMFA